MQGGVDPVNVGLVSGYMPRWYTRPKTVAHPSASRVPRRTTSPLRQTVNYTFSLTGLHGSYSSHPLMTIMLTSGYSTSVSRHVVH